MDKGRVIATIAALVTAATWLTWGCGTSDSAAPDVETSDAAPDTFVPDHDVPDDASQESSEPVDACVHRCSSDFRAVLDCNGSIVESCANDHACSDGSCVKACTAADKHPSLGGCEYYAAVPARWTNRAGQCYAVAIANTWTTDLTISVDYQGVALDVTSLARVPVGSGPSITYDALPGGLLTPGKVALLFLASYGTQTGSACPAGTKPAITDGYVERFGTTITDAFHIATDRPAFAYDFYPYGGGKAGNSTSTRLLSTSTWTTNYLAQTPYPRSILVEPAEALYVQVVAMADDTSVDILPSAAIVGNMDAGIPGADKGQAQTYTLNKGQVLQLVQSDELVGSTIASTKPVGVWGGATALNIEIDEFSADWVHQQVSPLRTLGYAYAAVRYRSRVDGQNENTPWRMVGTVDGTTLSYDPKRPKHAPETLGRGEVKTFKFALDEDPFPFMVSSQDAEHPFYFWAYMTGSQNASGFGDPEWISVVPLTQFLNRYVFFTDPTFPETNVVVIRSMTDGSFKDVTLDCLGTLSGWLPVNGSETVQYTRFDLSRGVFEAQGACHNGTHTMTSDAPFGITVWGWGTILGYANGSYAFSPGAALGVTNNVEIPILK